MVTRLEDVNTSLGELRARHPERTDRSDRAAAALRAAGLDATETERLLSFLCGWAPDGVLHGLASIAGGRR